MTKEKRIISLRGDRDLWRDFVYKVKKNNKEVWEVLSDFMRKYIKD